MRSSEPHSQQATAGLLPLVHTASSMQGCLLITGHLSRLMEASSEQQLCTYARINTLDLTLSPEISEYWQEPSSYFLAPGMSRSRTLHASHLHCLPLHRDVG